MMKNVYTLLVLLLTLGVSGQAQQQTISGVVRDIHSQHNLSGAKVSIYGTNSSTLTDKKGAYQILAQKGDTLVFSSFGYDTLKQVVHESVRVDAALQGLSAHPEIATVRQEDTRMAVMRPRGEIGVGFSPYSRSQERYGQIQENRFVSPLQEPFSTFAIDIDAASYSNVRRMINAGELPPKDAIRIEEMINYFQYALPAPEGNNPVGILTELTHAPWRKQHQLLRIALRAKDIPKKDLPAANLVFLIDVSGSMSGHNRLPLVKSALKLLVDQLRKDDRVAIVTYAGSATVKLENTSGDQKMRIKEAIDALKAGGATAGEAGINRAYQLAKKHFITAGNNRVIMASDGDFNVGEVSDQEMEDLIAGQRKSGVSLTVLGFGMGNLKDSKMELLANKGHGNYAYIDNISEARKAIISEFGGTLFTVAKDVKLQVEFNPAYVQAYRLVGYENRLLEPEEFNDDTRLGGDMGVGHSVTALYEVVPTGIESSLIGRVDALKYQNEKKEVQGKKNNELATIKFRYKNPGSESSRLQEVVVHNEVKELDEVSEDFRFASAVAEYGMLLRGSDFTQQSSFESLIERAKGARGADQEGYRMEFIRLAENSLSLITTNSAWKERD
ncbi:MAG: YfbK domain-containing protein [Sphingobacterium sp.]